MKQRSAEGGILMENEFFVIAVAVAVFFTAIIIFIVSTIRNSRNPEKNQTRSIRSP